MTKDTNVLTMEKDNIHASEMATQAPRPSVPRSTLGMTMAMDGITINKDNRPASEIPRSTLGMTTTMDVLTSSNERYR